MHSQTEMKLVGRSQEIAAKCVFGVDWSFCMYFRDIQENRTVPTLPMYIRQKKNATCH